MEAERDVQDSDLTQTNIESVERIKNLVMTRNKMKDEENDKKKAEQDVTDSDITQTNIQSLERIKNLVMTTNKMKDEENDKKEAEQDVTDSDLTETNMQSLERIKNLVMTTNKMKDEERDKKESIQNYFKVLRNKINSSTHFLTKIKQDIENIKFALEEDKKKSNDLNNSDYLELCNKTDEEIEEEFRKVHHRLDELQKRVASSKNKLVEDDKTFEETLTDTVAKLNNVSNGIITDNLE